MMATVIFTPVAHHASAVTITAGLGRNPRREPSMSGAEYDPDRPLQDIMAGMDTTEAVSLAARLRSPKAGHDLSASEEHDRSQEIPRPKLAETLQRVGFSPRRPRSVQSSLVHQSPGVAQDVSRRYADLSRRSITPKGRKASVVSFDITATPVRRHVSQPVTVQPHVNVQPPTPSTSNFTKMATGLTRDVRQAQDLSHVDECLQSAVPSSRHPIARDTTNWSTADVTGEPNYVSRLSKKSTRGRVHLPDVTGITNAVVSPAKGSLDRYATRGSGHKEVEARLVTSLNALHVRLSYLENENSIARRRVRELEYELEQCRRDVVKERTRVLESQDAIDVSIRPAGPSTSRYKGKEKKTREADQSASKYLEVVEEKKALEALISTLRSHLTRVTTDLSSQQRLLDDLRRLRESDALSLSEKTDEINQLRKEVERLAGEIEVLRGIVEEGLNERRQARASAEEDHGYSIQSSLQSNQTVTSTGEPKQEQSTPSRRSRPSTPALSLRRSASETSQQLNGSRPQSPALTERSRGSLVRWFINPEEIDRISADLEERRSERSTNASTSSGNASRDVNDHESVSHLQQHIEADVEVEQELRPVSKPATTLPSQSAKLRGDRQAQQHPPKEDKTVAAHMTSSTPFPRISVDLERLFFSTSRHSTNGCRTCKDRRSHGHVKEDGPPRKPCILSEAGKEGNEEDGLEASPLLKVHSTCGDNEASIEEGLSVEDILERMDRNGGVLKPDDIPPQTVLARVLRELEDEFTHYKEIYRELAEEYREMDCATEAAKRHTIAAHLRDVINVIEHKGDQITSLYGLLTFKDKPTVT
ncbi:hypothetical protein ID866_2825 [Astraeus odoratus]|nr:hypothetical protein ID866_2825 [Astraeus odoratus]